MGQEDWVENLICNWVFRVCRIRLVLWPIGWEGQRPTVTSLKSETLRSRVRNRLVLLPIGWKGQRPTVTSSKSETLRSKLWSANLLI